MTPSTATDAPPPAPDRPWLEGALQQIVGIMAAAVGEFSLAALLIIVGLLVATISEAVAGGLICIGAGAGLGYLGHRRGLADASVERERLDMAHRERLAEIAQEELLAKIAKQQHLAELESRERIAEARRRQVELPQLAAEVVASGKTVSHWKIKRGERRRPSQIPAGIAPLDYLVFRHTRSAEAPPTDPSLPAIRHFVDLRDAALVVEDRDLMVQLICDHIHESFEDHSLYTGVLIPRTGNVALGLAVADRLGITPVLVRDQPLFGRSTETVLTAGLLILVDDIWSDGAVLRRAVELARFDNFSVSDGVLLFARREGDVVHDLADSNLMLRPLYELGDEAIDAIISAVSAALYEQTSLGPLTQPQALGPGLPPTQREAGLDPPE